MQSVLMCLGLQLADFVQAIVQQDDGLTARAYCLMGAPLALLMKSQSSDLSGYASVLEALR